MTLQIVEQRSPEWFSARLGKVSCSRLGDIMATTKSGVSASRKNYMAELVSQRLTGTREETFQSSAMQWGTETEPLARSAYEIETCQMVAEHGGQHHSTMVDFWGSPDGIVGDNGGVEIKCPNTSTHIDTVLNGTVKQEYIYQMTGLLIIYDRDWWDFVSYDPRLPDGISLFRKRYEKNDLPVNEVMEAVQKFILELEDLESMLREKMLS
jgi:hypothetical protein